MQSTGNLEPQVEPMDEDSSDISESLLEEPRRCRYRFVPLEEASDSGLWMDVRHGGLEAVTRQWMMVSHAMNLQQSH